MELIDVFHSDPEILGGTPVFVGTRVPVQTLLVYLQSGATLDEFLDNFPTVSKGQAVAFLEEAGRALLDQIEAASIADIDRQLIEDAANPDAWDPPLTVTPVRSRRRSSYREEIPIATAEKSGVSEKQRNR